jgi:hypothetical protein
MHAHPPPLPLSATPPADLIYAPEALALMDLAAARTAVAALTPAQRQAQAQAHAAWLASFGYVVCPTEILAAWDGVAPPSTP